MNILHNLTKKQTILSSIVVSILVVALIVATFAFSCRHVYPQELVAIDSLCESKPDSARLLLDRLSAKEYSSESGRMYYALLKIKAANNLYEPQRDSTIFHVVDYFDKYGDKGKRREAYYYLGKYYVEYNDAPYALKCFQIAMDLSDDKTPLLFKSKVFNQSGWLFFDQGLYKDALLMFKKSYSCDTVLNDTANMINSLRDIAQTYMYMGNSEKCIALLGKAYKLSSSYNDKELCGSIVIVLASRYLDLGKFSEAYKLLPDLYASASYDILKSPAYCTIASIYESEGSKDSVYYYSKLLLSVGTVDAKVSALKKLVKYYSYIGNNVEANKSLDRYFAYSDSLRDNLAAGAVAKLHSLYDYGLREKENSELKQNNREHTYVFIFSLALFIFLSFAFMLQRKKKIFELRQVNEHMASLYYAACEGNKHFLELKSEEIQDLNDRINKLSSENFDELKKYQDEVIKLKNVLNESIKNSRNEKKQIESEKIELYEILKNRIRHGSNLTLSDWNRIFNYIDSVYPNFKASFCGKIDLRGYEYKACVLVKMGLLNVEIAKLLYRSPSTITMLRATLYEKITSKKGKAKDFDKFIMSLK